MEGQNKSVRLSGGLSSLFLYPAKNEKKNSDDRSECVQIQSGPVTLEGNLQTPPDARGLIVFVHGSGSSRLSPRNQTAAQQMREAGMATLLFDLLTPEEEEADARSHQLRYDIGLLARRTIGAVDWVTQKGVTRAACIGLFGASTGAAAALITAAERPRQIGAVVSRGGRPDLAAAALTRVQAPMLFLVAQRDPINTEVNRIALQQIAARKPAPPSQMRIVPGADALFEERNAANFVLKMAVEWFRAYLDNPTRTAKNGNKG